MFKSSSAVKIFLWAFAAILVFVMVVLLWIISSLNQDLVRSAQTRFTIEQGWGVQQIAEELEHAGIVSSKYYFIIAAKIENAGSELQAAEYIIPAAASPVDLVKLFSSGRSDDEVSVRIREELTLQQVAQDVADQTDISEDDFFAAASETNIKELFPEATFPSLADKPTDKGLEGYLYPDTYKIFSYAKASDLIFKALTNFESKLTQEDRDAIKAQGKTLFQVLTLASIVEREEPNESERATVAGVFWNRLAIGMALQSDATINYVFDSKGLDRNAQPTSEQLTIESPYNTYLYSGLPPGPITNPTIESIEATIHYSQTDYYYFLHPQDGSKRTIYARTLEEHNANKTQYLD